ncbi:type III secretion system gatekeeper subunit SctW [Dyella sp. Tek66A03]|uniref:type III secretion system gatekeeper subunit SctW n=1 Tax=Dyella sp. Tek66A03 TaxID=3458298 RepID=UPI00403E87EC
MASPVNLLPMLVTRARPALKTKSAGKDDFDKEENEVVRAPTKKGELHTALEMHDDLSALMPALRLRRDEHRGAYQLGCSWVDHVIEENAPEKLASLKTLLLAGRAEAVDIRAALSALFPDPSDAVSVLRAMLSDHELEESRVELQRELDRFLEELHQGSGVKSMLAGINVALKAKLRAKMTGISARDLRESYRDFLGTGSDTLGQYALWIELYGFDKRFEVIDFIEQALGADMYALDPSCSRLEFGRLLKVVRRLTTLRSADHALMKHCWREKIMERIGVDEPTLLRGLLSIVRNGGGLPVLFEGALSGARFGLRPAEKSLMAQGLRNALRAIPHDIWHDVAFQLQALDEIEQLVVRAMAVETAATAPGMKVDA